MPTTLLDTGLIYALFDQKDQHYRDAAPYVAMLETHRVILIWPVVYEALRARFVEQPRLLESFRKFAGRPNVDIVDDARYRLTALEDVYRWSSRRRSISLVDALLRSFMQDPMVRVDMLLTFNHRDFVDVYRIRDIQMPAFSM